MTAKLLSRMTQLDAFSREEEEEIIKNVSAVAFEGKTRTALCRKLSH